MQNKQLKNIMKMAPILHTNFLFMLPAKKANWNENYVLLLIIMKINFFRFSSFFFLRNKKLIFAPQICFLRLPPFTHVKKPTTNQSPFYVLLATKKNCFV